MYNSQITTAIATQYAMEAGDTDAIQKEIVRSFLMGKEEGIQEERRKRNVKTYACKECGKIVPALFEDGKGACCFSFEDEQKKLMIEEEDLNGNNA